MNSMPWQLSYGASADLDNSELQTDVMRFMAILAFCLVAIFAIVQSMPLEPQAVTKAAPTAMSTVSPPSPVVPVRTLAPVPVPKTPAREPVPKPVSAPANTAVLTMSEPKPEPKPATTIGTIPLAASPVAKPLYVPAPKPAPVETLAVEPPTPRDQSVVAGSAQGLSLSFESDDVLRRLVARRLVGLYAIDGNDFYQMAVDGRQFVFAPGAAPGQYHEMVFETVPAEVSRSFEAQLPRSAREVVWGVTLPVGTTRQLRRFVQTNFSGSLVINDDAQLALPGSG